MSNKITKQEIKDNLIYILENEIGIDTDNLDFEDNLFNQLDSLDTVELIMKLEIKYQIAIPDSDAEQFNTYQDVLDYLEKALIV